MKTVILAEKPDQARKYASAMNKSESKKGYIEVEDSLFNGECVITYGFGHLVEMAEPSFYGEEYESWNLNSLPLLPDNYIFHVDPLKVVQFNIVQKQLESADEIIIATDPDREGENIAWSILNKCNLNLDNDCIKRLWINSLEKNAIRKGFENLHSAKEHYSSFIEAQSRQISDWIFGMNGSPLYTLTLKDKGLISENFSIGRVQTPTLYMIYQRILDIKNFKKQPYQELEIELSKDNMTFKGTLEPNQKFMSKQELELFMTNKNIQLGDNKATIEDVETTEKTTSSPLLFSLSSLQSEASKKYKISASDTLNTVQKLYESKFLTYPRTDCHYITNEEFSYLKDNLNHYKQFLNVDFENHIDAEKRYVNDKKVQEHHAIIVTRTIPTQEEFNKFTQNEKHIYELVLRRVVSMFAPKYRYKQTIIISKVNEALFKSVGNTPIEQGFKVVLNQQKEEKKDNDEQVLPVVNKNDILNSKISTLNKETKPPKPYTEGTLITAMKHAGKDIDDSDEKAILSEVEGIGTEATRASIIERLKDKNYIYVDDKNYIAITSKGILLCQAIKDQPLLKSAEMTAKWEAGLKQIRTGERTQDNFLSQVKKFVAQLVSTVPTQINNNVVLDNMIKAVNNNKKIGKCPKCSHEVVDCGSFVKCENDNCDFSLSKIILKKQLTNQQISQLINKGITQEISGFISQKTEKKFSAKLKLNDEYKTEFIFNSKKKGKPKKKG